MVGSLIFDLNVSSDVTSIIIKNEIKFPYLKVSLNSLVFDLSQLSVDNLGDYIANLSLKNTEYTADYPFRF